MSSSNAAKTLHIPTAVALAVGALAGVPAAHAAPTVWDIDTSHASAEFKVRHLMVSNVRGQLGPVKGTVFIDEQDVTKSKVEVSIDATKIDSRDAKRDEHMRSPDFLDVGKHPNVTFTSTAVKKASGGHLAVTGNLTIRGVTRPVTLDVDGLPAAVSDPWGNTKRGATAHTSINRKDFGLTWNMALEAGGVVVGDKVDIALEVELVKHKDAVVAK